MDQLGELGTGVAPLLQVEVRPVVDRLDDDLLAPTSGEEDERDFHPPLPNGLEKLDPVHLRHLVVGDDRVAAWKTGGLQCFACGGAGDNDELSRPFEEETRQLQKIGLVVDIEEVGHPVTRRHGDTWTRVSLQQNLSSFVPCRNAGSWRPDE